MWKFCVIQSQLVSIRPASLFLNAFAPTHTSTGLGAENDRLLTSAFDNILLSLSTRYQKEEKDGKLTTWNML